MKYDKTRYLYLLKQEESLKKQGKSLYEESQENYLELLGYQVQLEGHRYWENRQKYIFVMNQFINGICSGEDFDDEFLWLWRNDRDAAKTDFEFNIMAFEPNIMSKSKIFSNLINRVFFDCEVFEPEAEEGEEYDEKWLKESVKRTLKRIKELND